MTDTVKFTPRNSADFDLIAAIADRAYALDVEANGRRLARDAMHHQMNVSACHASGNPLRLADLLAADNFNFAHDVFGIDRHINRETGQMENCFSPRFSARTTA